jgi:glycosyltransferase involved in cell wall biosynthesis
MITFNHEAYINEAINGILMQDVNFPIELVIGEDCSTDNTRKICMEYQKKYPSLIKLLLPKENLGMQQNFVNTLFACQGKYIAICEGDDYWTDPYKLQKQVDFLEANEDFAICFHPVDIFKQKENIFVKDYITPDVPDITDVYYLAKKCNYIHTASVLFRKNESAFEILKSSRFSIGDYPLHLLNAKYGKIKKLSDKMSVYRVHDGGIWSSNQITKTHPIVLALLEQLMVIFNSDPKAIECLKEQYANIAFVLYGFYEKNNDLLKAKEYFFKVCLNSPEIIYNEIFSIKHSKTYRFGNVLLFLPRLIKNIFR